MNKHTVTGLTALALAFFSAPVTAAPSAIETDDGFFSELVAGIANGASSLLSSGAGVFDEFLLQYNLPASGSGIIDPSSAEINVGAVTPVAGMDISIKFEHVPNFPDFTWPYDQIAVGIADLNPATSFTGGIATGPTSADTVTLANSLELNFAPQAYSVQLNNPDNIFTFFGSAGGGEPLHFQNDPNHWRIFADTGWSSSSGPAVWILLFDAEGSDGNSGYNDGVFVLAGYTVHAVPEPALIGLLALPGLFLVFHLRRRCSR